jgi:hypothetical protein
MSPATGPSEFCRAARMSVVSARCTLVACRMLRPGRHNWSVPTQRFEQLLGSSFGTLLAHLPPQNGTKQHDRAPLSHCGYRW